MASRKETIVYGENIGPSEMSETVYNALEEIRLKHPQKRLMPNDIVRVAKRKNHPLHKYFEWDDTEAAHKFRTMQAALMVRAVVKVVDRGHGKKRIRAYVSMRNIRPGTGDIGGYEQTTAVVRRKTDREQLIINVVRKLDNARQEMEAIEELTGPSSEIESIMDNYGLTEMLEV